MRLAIVLAATLLPAALAPAQELTFRRSVEPGSGPGSEDGPGSRARFVSPRGVAVHASGTVYVADSENHTIRMISPGGVVSTLAGLAGREGSADGRGSAARFRSPHGLAVDGEGNVYVADWGNRTIRLVRPNGEVTTLAGRAGQRGSEDGVGSAALFDTPLALAIEPSGSLLVADGRLRRVSVSGVVTTRTAPDGSPLEGYARGIAVDGAGNAYAAIWSRVVKVTPDGVISTVAGDRWASGIVDGVGEQARFMTASGITSDAAGNLWVTDGDTVRSVTREGVVSTLAGSPLRWGFKDGPGPDARFSYPVAIARAPGGALVVADTGNHAVRGVSTSGQVTTRVGIPSTPDWADSTDLAATWWEPAALAWDGLGNLYVADSLGRTVRTVSAAGPISILAGSPGTAGSADGTGSAARFRDPLGIAVDAGGTLYVADSVDHTVRRIAPTGEVTTLAGSPQRSGVEDGAGSAARFNAPSGIAIDGEGTLRVADTDNCRIRKVTPDGVVTTLAGGPCGSVDGIGPNARFMSPTAVAVDREGNVLVADTGNHAIRRISPTGVVVTVAGLPGVRGNRDGVASEARFDGPSGIAVDANGDVLVVDRGNWTIRRIGEGGVVTTVAGFADPTGGFVEGTGAAIGFSGVDGRLVYSGLRQIAVGPGGLVAVTDGTAIRIGRPALPDEATIDAPAGPVGVSRQLGATGAAATAWSWELARIEGGSVAAAEPATSRDATFTPDLDGLFVFRLRASDGSRERISTVSLAAGFVAPTALVTGDASVCLGTTAEVRVELTGTPPWRLAWTDGLTQDGIGSSPLTRQVTASTNEVYALDSVSNAYGDGPADGSATVSRLGLPSAKVSGGGSFCHGSEATLRVDLTGWRPWTLHWSDGVVERTQASPHERRVAPSVATTYTLLGVSDANCAGTTSGSATASPQVPPTALALGTTVVCAGQTAEIRAELTGTAPWTVTWSDGFVDSDVVASPARRIVRPGATKTYRVTNVSDAACSGEATGSAVVTVLSGPAPSAEIATASPVSPGSAGLVASVPDAGPGATYAWSLTNATLESGQGTRQIAYSVGEAGLAHLAVTVAVPGGCEATGATWTWVGADPVEPIYFSLLAGPDGGGGWFDGTGAAARFSDLAGITTDAAGNVYVSEPNHGTIRRIAPDGQVSTLAGIAGFHGAGDGKGPLARFNGPAAMATSGSGSVYVYDEFNELIRLVRPDGEVSTLQAGSTLKKGGVAAAAPFTLDGVVGMAADAAGNLFATTTNRMVLRVTPSGSILRVAGSSVYGCRDGRDTDANFAVPSGIALDASGNLYVADTGCHTIRRVSPDGTVTTLAGVSHTKGSRDGAAAQALFSSPEAVAVDAAGRVFVADTGNRTVRVLSPAGEVSTLAGLSGVAGGADGSGADARFSNPVAISVEAAGSLVVADGRSVRRVTPSGQVTTLAGLADALQGFADGAAPDVRFSYPRDAAADRAGNVYVADPNNHVIRKVAPSGATTTYAGTPGTYGFADGPAESATFYAPRAVALDATGALLVADSGNNAVRRIGPAGDVATLAGDGVYGSRDGTGRQARFGLPEGVAVDPAGNVWVSDTGNKTLRRISPTGVVTTVAGRAQAFGSSDGTGGAARFRRPVGVAADRSGSVYVADEENHTIRKVTPEGVVTTLAGAPGEPALTDGTGGAARLSYPRGIRLDGSGSLYVADYGNGALRKVSPTGAVTTLGGSRFLFGGADGTGEAALFGRPSGVAVRHTGEVALVESPGHALWLGAHSLADTATIDAMEGAVGETRRLGVAPRTATVWRWEVVRRESASRAVLSATDVADPTFTPDAPGYYRFRLTASDGAARSVTLVSLVVGLPRPTAHVSGGGVFCPGDPVRVYADLTGIPPLTVIWSDGVVWDGVRDERRWRFFSATSSLTLGVVSVSNASGPGDATGSALVEVTRQTGAPVVTAPAAVVARSTGHRASVERHDGSRYVWSITNGTITAGWSTNEVVFDAGYSGTTTLEVVEQAPGECASPAASAVVALLPATSATRFHTVVPCRLVDTREAAGPTFGFPLPPNLGRSFAAAGACGIPATARALAANVTATDATARGTLVVYPADEPKPVAATVHYSPGRSRAANSLLKLSTDGTGRIAVANEGSGSVHLIVDVGGYFE